MDCFGRKRSLIYFGIFPISSWAIILLATCPLHLHVARIIAGLWLGIIMTIAPMYTGEVAEPEIRGILANLYTVMLYAGELYMYSVGPYVSYFTEAVTAVLVPINFLIILLFIPESPYYFLLRKDKDAARTSLRWLRGNVSSQQLEHEINQIEKTVEHQLANKGSIMKILKSVPNQKAFFVVQLYAMFVKLSGRNLLSPFSSITMPEMIFNSLSVREYPIILSATWIFSALLSLFFIDRIGRKFLLAGTSFMCSIMLFLIGLWFYLDTRTSVDVGKMTWLLFVFFITLSFFHSLGLGPVGAVMKGELLSVEIRASASAVSTIVSALYSVLLSYTYLPIANQFGIFTNFWIYSTSCFLCFLFTIFVFVETKGRTLQEIQDDLTKTKFYNVKKHLLPFVSCCYE